MEGQGGSLNNKANKNKDAPHSSLQEPQIVDHQSNQIQDRDDFSIHIHNERTKIAAEIDKLQGDMKSKQEELDKMMDASSINLSHSWNNPSEFAPISFGQSPMHTQTQISLLGADAQFAHVSLQQDQHQSEESLALYRQIREKTKQVEEQSNKIDEMYQVSFTLENQIERVGRYCMETYGSLKGRLDGGSLKMAEVR